jgi:hypothetical protein
MRPVGLALKATHKKYGRLAGGELMLAHLCVECNKVSLNRMAADDDIEKAWGIYTSSCEANRHAIDWPAESEVTLLGHEAQRLVRAQLYGNN